MGIDHFQFFFFFFSRTGCSVFGKTCYMLLFVMCCVRPERGEGHQGTFRVCPFKLVGFSLGLSPFVCRQNRSTLPQTNREAPPIGRSCKWNLPFQISGPFGASLRNRLGGESFLGDPPTRVASVSNAEAGVNRPSHGPRPARRGV